MPLKLSKNKKAVSIVIGYVLLITTAIVMSVIVYQWLRSYVPREKIECPEDVSISVIEYNYSCSENALNFTIRNNGKFNVNGYFIRASNNSEDEIATLDLTPYHEGKGNIGNGAVLLEQTNVFPLNPGEEASSENVFDLTLENGFVGEIDFIELIPVRFEEVEGKRRFTSCGEEKIKQQISCTD